MGCRSYVGEKCPAEVLDKLFGAGSVDDLARVGELMRLRDNDLSHAVHAIINELRKTMLPFVPIVVVTPKVRAWLGWWACGSGRRSVLTCHARVSLVRAPPRRP